MAYTIRDVSGGPLTVDSFLTASNAQLPKFALSDPTGTAISQVNPLWIQTPDCPVTASASASAVGVVFSIDTTTYQSVAVQFTSVGTTNTVLFECSNDNINWTAVVGAPSSNTGSAAPVSSVASPTVGIVYYFPVFAQYFRARVSTYTSGTVTLVYRLRDTPYNSIASFLGAGSVAVSNVPGVYSRGATTGGLSQARYISGTAATANTQVIKASAGQLYGYTFYNAATSVRYIHFYNITTAPTMGTSADARVIAVPPSSSLVYNGNDIGIAFSAGIAIAVTTAPGATDNTVASIAVNDIVGMVDFF